MEDKKVKKQTRVIETKRDLCLYEFLDRVGVANYEQIKLWLDSRNYKSTLDAVKQRLRTLARFNRVKSFQTYKGTYYALNKHSQRQNALITKINFERLDHEDFLRNLYLEYDAVDEWLTSRQILSEIRVGTRSQGIKIPIPDMIIRSYDFHELVHIEYERTRKSGHDVKNVIFDVIHSPRRSHFNAKVLIIAESVTIFNNYVKQISCFQNQVLDMTKDLQAFNVRDVSHINGVLHDNSGEFFICLTSNYKKVLGNKFNVTLPIKFDENGEPIINW
jgi:hypothetical protein